MSGAQPAAVHVERREIIVPAGGAERVRIDNPLGRVQVRGWNRRGEIHIVADKRSPTREGIDRLRVHYTAWQSGEIQIDARVELGGRERSLPLTGSGVDLLIELPPELEVAAKTFAGDVSVSGVDAGAHLETTGGRIGVSQVRGSVVTRQLRGGQTVVGVDGDIDLDGIEGDMHLRQLVGGRVDARLVDGSIRAENIRSRWVRLRSTTGEVVFVGLVIPGGRYDMRSYAGAVRFAPDPGSPAFELWVRSPQSVDSVPALRDLVRQGETLRAVHAGGRPSSSLSSSDGSGRALVELSSMLGRVSIQPR